MAAYEYDCTSCGRFTTVLPIGTAGPVCLCPSCGMEAHRVWTAPSLVGGPAPIRSLLADAERSADSPTVVRRLPAEPAAGPMVRRHGPGAQALPRP